ncbi:MAG: glycosyltransferase family 4 protein [Armatimonadota bacterium]|nr:glycosyltransferase family 4 protein [Armatimonadota bacterium]
MRVALLAWESLHSIAVGGVAVHVTELAAALERRGHEVHVFTRMGPGQPHLERIHGVWYHRCPFDLHHDFVEEIHNMCRSFVHHLFATEDYMGAGFDVVHAHDWLTALAMIWIKEGRGRKGILTMHSTEYGRCGNQFFGGKSARIRDLEWQGTYWADRVIAVSHALGRELQWIYHLPEWKIHVIYNGINPHAFDGFIDAGAVKGRYGIGPMDPTILFCGRVTYQKGPDLLVGAIPMILHYHPHAKFVFVGDGDLRWSCEEQARGLGVAHACRFLGYRNGGELIDLYKACDGVCVPSRNEPFGLTILEAWSAGKPVVVTKNGGPDEYVEHGVNGLKIYAHPESVAWGIGTLFQDFERARWMGRNGRMTVEGSFGWDRVAEQTLSVYAA